MDCKLISEFVVLKAKLFSIKLAVEYTFKLLIGNKKKLIDIKCKKKCRERLMKLYILFKKAQKQRVELFGSAKQSAKGVTRYACSKTTHEIYKQVLSGGETVRLSNTRIASSKHQSMTVNCNRKLLYGFDKKRYIFDDSITKLPDGNNNLREEIFTRIFFMMLP